MDYVSALENSKFVPNVIIRFMGEYWSIRQPNSGLIVDTDKVGIVASLQVNPTSLDPFFPSTTISNYSFKMLDKNGVISALLNGVESYFQGEQVEVWIGRYGLNAESEMDFSEYLKLPIVFVNKASKPDVNWTFQAVEARDRLRTGAFNVQTKLAVDILVGTTIITVQDTTFLPTNGLIKIDNEFISYTGITGNNLENCIRGERTTTPAGHDLGADVFLVEEVNDNPINVLLQLLISSGGGGTYDVLTDGAAIDESLVDIDQFEEVRDEFFSGQIYDFALLGIEDLKSFIESELLQPMGIRLRSNNNGKIGVALINRNFMEIDAPVLDARNQIKQNEFNVDNTKVRNRIRIQWDYNDSNGMYLKQSEFTDTDSITTYGPSDWVVAKFKGVKEDFDGETIVADIALLFLNRYKQPRPEVKSSAFMNASYLNLGDKVDLNSQNFPNDEGVLNFASTLEVVQRSINYETGDCTFTLQFTAFTGVRQCYIAPSDAIVSHSAQNVLTVGAGRGAYYRKGWIMRLYDGDAFEYADAQENEILSVVGDVITFVDDWATTLVNAQHRIMFCDYDTAVEQQKRFCFISDDGNNFDDGLKSYAISFG